MEKVIFLPLDADLVSYVADRVIELSNGPDMSKINVVFPGKRPGHFLRIKLKNRLKGPFYPPEIKEIETFVHEIALKRYGIIRKIDPLNAAWLLYDSIKKFVDVPEFESFYQWAINLYKLFDELDQELVDDLSNISNLVEIESDLIPDRIIDIWSKIQDIKEDFDERLIESHYYTPGMLYRLAAMNEDFIPENFTIFAGFFALPAALRKIFKNILENDRGIVIFQGDPDEWSILREVKGSLPEPQKLEKSTSGRPDFKIFSGFDLHSEMAKVRDVLSELEGELTDEPEKLAIIVPKTESLIPLIYESISHFEKNFNIALGYPLKRTPLISLYESVFRAQENRTDTYFRRDVLKVLTHPFIKNIRIKRDTTPFRIAVHTFEEFVNQSEIVVFDLRDEAFLAKVFERIRKVQESPELADEVTERFKEVLRLFFYNFENISTFRELKTALEESANFLLENSTMGSYRLNFEFLSRFFETVREIGDFFFVDEKFDAYNIYRIFLYRLKEVRVAFEGTPVKGIQILGPLEARGLNFKNIIYLDMNEGVVPGEPDINPILPPPLRSSLGLSDYRKTEEVYRYHFKRLFSSARRAYLLYIDTPDRSRSRYIERLIWEKEKEFGELIEDIEKRIFNVKFERKVKEPVEKTPEVMEVLKNMTWSPTAVDSYFQCPMRFYFQYILNLRDKSFEDDIGKDRIGQIVHTILQEFYSANVGKKADYERILTVENLVKTIDEVFKMNYPENWGTALLVKKATEKALRAFLAKERMEKRDRIILGLEKNLRGRLKFGSHELEFTGRIDRIERIDGEIFITDYKTSRSLKNPDKNHKDWLYTTKVEDTRRFVESFQLPIYLELYKKYAKIRDYENINARLVSIQKLDKEVILFKDEDKNKRARKMEFFNHFLSVIFDEILNPEVPFYVEEGDHCKNCPFKEFCGVE